MNAQPEYTALPSGLIVPGHVAAEKERKARRPRAIDLFGGCGGMSLGLIKGGFEVLAGVDHDATAAHTYMTNLGAYPCRFLFIEDADRERMERELAKSFKPGANGLATAHTAGSGWLAHNPGAPGVPFFFLGDVRKLDGADVLDTLGLERGELDLVAGGPPCQGFSTSGKRDVMDPRNSLVFEFARLVCELNPKSVVFENVPGIVDMVTPEGVPVVDAFCRILEDGGFAGVDALYRSIAAQSERVGLLRNNKGAQAKKARPDADGGQLGLFDKEVA